MNERQKVNKIIHTYVEVNKCEDYTDYKGLITALINWKNEQLTLTDVVKSLPQDNYCQICNLPTDGEKCFSKRCPIQWLCFTTYGVRLVAEIKNELN